MKRKWLLVGGVIFLLLVIGIVKNNQPRQKEAWIYDQHGRLIKHYSLPDDRHKLTELGRMLGDSGGRAEHLFAQRPRNATIKNVYRWRENGRTTKITVYTNRDIYVDTAIIRAKGKLTPHEYQQLTRIH